MGISIPLTGGSATVPLTGMPACRCPSAFGTSTFTVKFVVPGCSASRTATTVPLSLRVCRARRQRNRSAVLNLDDLRGRRRQERVDARDLFDREELTARRILAGIRVDRIDDAVERRNDRRAADLAAQLLDRRLRGIRRRPRRLQFRLLNAGVIPAAVGARVGDGLIERRLRGADRRRIRSDRGALLVDRLRGHVALIQRAFGTA